MDPSSSSTQDASSRAMEALLSARRAVLTGLDKSHALSASLSRSSPRIADLLHHHLPALESSVRPICAPLSSLPSVGSNIDRAVGPAAAVLKVFDAVHGLEPALLPPTATPSSDMPGFLSVVLRLEEALQFLSDNIPLAVQWLEDILEFLSDGSVADPRFISRLSEALSHLKSSGSDSPLDGGLLAAALDVLEAEFRGSLLSDQPINDSNKFSPLLERMAANGRLERCAAVYVEVRGSAARASLAALGLEYLDDSSDDAQALGPEVEKWGSHLEFAVRQVLDREHRISSAVFDAFPDTRASCFAKVAIEAGVTKFLQFGQKVCGVRKDPIKLLRLLELFRSLNLLRLEFNRLFGGKACEGIQSHTRDLVKQVVNGAAEIFQELLTQVELQRRSPPPSDGGIPRLVSFATTYCNQLLADNYRLVLTQVLTIQRSWKKERFHERILVDDVLRIIRALEANAEAWSKGYEKEDAAVALPHLFMMNVHWYFFKSLRGTAVGKALGEEWLQEHEKCRDYYAALLMRESWGKLPTLLSREGLMLFSGGRVMARELVKKRLKAFNAAFDETYRLQSKWVIPDKELREWTCGLVVQAVVPVYRSYMQNYGPLVEQDAGAATCVKYTAQDLEKMLGSLYQSKPRRAGSFAARHANGKVHAAMSSLYRSASAVK